MSDIYLKVTNEKKWRFQNFDCLNLKNSSPGQFLASNFKTSFCNMKIRGLGTKLYVAFPKIIPGLWFLHCNNKRRKGIMMI